MIALIVSFRCERNQRHPIAGLSLTPGGQRWNCQVPLLSLVDGAQARLTLEGLIATSHVKRAIDLAKLMPGGTISYTPSRGDDVFSVTWSSPMTALANLLRREHRDNIGFLDHVSGLETAFLDLPMQLRDPGTVRHLCGRSPFTFKLIDVSVALATRHQVAA